MRQTTLAGIAIGLIAFSGAAHAQGFTPQQLDKMSQERLDGGAFRKFAAPPAPSNVAPPVPLHPAQGLWVCMSTDPYVPILAQPSRGAPVIGQSMGRIAAGADKAGYTSVLAKEGLTGWVPKTAVRPYSNEFNPRATCTVGGVRPNGMVTFDLH